MAVVPSFRNNSKLPVYQCEDKGLEQALNTLARAIEGLVIPDVRLPSGAGTMEWSGGDVLLRPTVKASTESRRPWAPVFYGGDGVSEVSFGIGTINGVVPSNWSAKHSIAGLGPSDYRYVVLNVTTSSGAVTGATLSLDNAPVSSDSVTKNTPPTSFALVLGAFWLGGYQMLITHNLQALASVVFIEQKASVGAGQLPYDNWYRWEVTAVDDTLY